MRRAPVLIALLLSAPVLAAPVLADCPPSPDTGPEIRNLLAQARAAGTEMEGRALTNRMWEIWSSAPDDQAQALLDRGMTARASYNFTEALDAFDRLTAYCPAYAEGYNQRAFVNFIRGDYGVALDDLDRAIALSPDHVAAAAGRALTLLGMGEIAEGQAALREVLARHPWLPERGHLIPEDQIPRQGQKL
ncbi:tetratricopeptide repeat protein [Primorskyibacter flagellatus]|nr:tetratricopeptide repeat protein [Primorskyibacter flagellatus]